MNAQKSSRDPCCWKLAQMVRRQSKQENMSALPSAWYKTFGIKPDMTNKYITQAILRHTYMKKN